MTESLLTPTTEAKTNETNALPPEAKPGGQSATSSTATNTPVEPKTKWQQTLDLIEDEGIRSDKSLAKFQKPDDLIKSYKALEAAMGADKATILKIPTVPFAEAPDAYNEIFDKLGRPKEAKEYGIKAPEGIQMQDGALDQFTELAHKNGMSKTQAAALAEWYFNNTTKAFQVQADTRKADFEKNMTDLKTEFGQAYEEKLGDAKKAIIHLGGQELLDQVNKSGQGANAAFIKAMAKAGAMLREDGHIKENSASENRNMSPAEARQQFNTYAADKEFQGILYDKSHPQQKWAKDEIARLVKFGAMDVR